MTALPPRPEGALPPLVSRRMFVLAGGGLVAAAALGVRSGIAFSQTNADVPTFQQVTGVPLGVAQASSEQIDTYVQRVAEASPRVITDLLSPPSVEGRPLRYAIVSHPGNLARLDQIADRTRALRLTPPAAAARERHARDLPAFVNVIANVHGNEPSGSDAVMQLLYELAARDDEQNLARLRALVLVLMPVQNPDGREARRRVNANGFDCNRDWFAMTQRETIGKVGLYARFPPVVSIDSHEQFLSAPDTFFFPPDNDPVHHETSRVGLDASDKVVSPAIEKAFSAKGYRWQHYGAYDIFYPGYGDSVPNHAFGAAGILFEQENNEVYARKVDRQFTALDASVDATAATKEPLLRAWAAQWPAATAAGRDGALAANLRNNPANRDPKPVPLERVYGYAFRTTSRAADVAHLVDRLRSYGVQVHVANRTVKLKRLRRFGADAFGPAALGRGTIFVTTAQPLKAWVHILLADDPFPAVPYFYDVAGWSNPALMALEGGAVGEPIAPLLRSPGRTRSQLRRHVRRRPATLQPVERARDLQRPLPGATAYAFALDAALAQAAAFALIADGVPLRRAPAAVDGLPAGAAVLDGSARGALDDAARRFGIRPRALAAAAGDLEPTRRPRVALMHDPAADTAEIFFASSTAFALWLLRDRFGLPLTRVSPTEVDAGALDGGAYDALVVPGGFGTVIPGGGPQVTLTPPGGGLTPLGLQSVQRFVAGGGTFVGYRSQGIAVASAAGIAGDLATRQPPSGFVVPGGPVQVELLGDDPAVRGLGSTAFAFNVADPILTGGGQTIVRYPDRLRALFYSEQLDAVNGTVAGTTVATGAGRSYVFSFDPAYRGFVEGTQRLLGAALLTPPGVGPRPPAKAALGVDVGAAARLVGPARQIIVRVAAADGAALRAAVAALEGAPADLRVVAAPGGEQAAAVDTDPLSGHPAAWAERLIAALARGGVRPTLIVA